MLFQDTELKKSFLFAGGFAVVAVVYDGEEDHQEAEFAVDGAGGGVGPVDEPDGGGGEAADDGQEEGPPQDAGGGVGVAPEACEPVGTSVMQVDMAE